METPELVQRLSDRVHAGSAEPVAQLIVEELWLAVVDGSLETGQRLPTTRELAITLGVSPRSIERAYAELERRGVLTTRTGSGSFVSLTQPSEHDLARHRKLAALCSEVVRRATELGFDTDDVIDALSEFRSLAQETQTPESRR